MKIYGCQFDIAWENKDANFEKVRALLAKAKPEKGSLVLLPEMFATGFSMNVNSITESPESGPTAKFLAERAASHGIYMLGGFVTRGDDVKGRNELAVFAPDGKRIARYAKIHPFSYGEESQHYGGGDRLCSFAWNGTIVAPFICYDMRFPEIFRLAMRGGAEIMTVIASWPKPREEHWLALLRARAIENQAYIVGVNRCGRDPNVSYGGRSQVIDPRGTVIADAGNGEGIFGAEIDIPALRAYRKEFPALRDVRPQFLGEA